MILTIEYPAQFEPECRWILSTIFRDDVILTHESSSDPTSDFVFHAAGRKLVVRNAFFARAAEDWLRRSNLPSRPLPRWRPADSGLIVKLTSESVPVLFGEPGFQFDERGDGCLGLDVFGSAFFMLSRFEELVTSTRDSHGRFPATASIAFGESFLDRPLVDEYAEILWAALRQVWPQLQRKAHSPRMLVSHDVDAPALHAFRPWSNLLRSAAAAVLKRGSIREATRSVRIRRRSTNAIDPNDPYNTFEWIMDLSERSGLRSAFYFICGRTNRRYDAQYEIEHPAIRQLLRTIHARGHEIGLHPSYETYRDPQAIVREAARLRRVCAEEGIRQDVWGGRMHFLRWEMPTTLYGWEQAGMHYDSTLSFADMPGFRCGTCRPYSAFDLIERRCMQLRIVPLIAMECTILDKRYLGLGATAAAHDKLMQLKRACYVVGGTFSLLWHNSRLVRRAEREIYESVVTAKVG